MSEGRDKSTRERLLKGLLGNLTGAGIDTNLTRDIVINFLSKAGKGKDEFVQVLGREIGLALAAVLEKPLSQLAENNRISVTIELEPKDRLKKKRSTSKRP
jgi:hypothetical protein